MPESEKYSAAWPQFLVAKREMLDQYDRAQLHAKSQPVATHHGSVAEAAFRDWLATFLPKHYGVASGYIRSQGLPRGYQTKHFDVIVYDQLEAPTLWIEENKDKSESGRARIIPAEFVQAVLEVKSTFNRRTVREAVSKLGELRPLMTEFNEDDDHYPRFLPASAVTAMVFFELRSADKLDIEALNLLRAVEFQRTFYGAIILRGEGLNLNDAALVQRVVSKQQFTEIWTEDGLLHPVAMTAPAESAIGHTGSLLKWGDTVFAGFAFDLLALLNGTFRQGFVSSFHGMEIQDSGDKK